MSYLEAADLLASTRDLIASRRFDELVHEAEVTSETGHRRGRQKSRFRNLAGVVSHLTFGDSFALYAGQVRTRATAVNGRDF